MPEENLYSYASGYGSDGLGKLGKYYVRLSIGPYERRTPWDTAGIKPEKYVYLPLPMEMRDDTYSSYNNVDTGLIGNIMDNGVGAGSNYVAELLKQSGQLITGGQSMIAGGLGEVASKMPLARLIGKTIQKGLENAFPPEAITSAISQYVGASANPNPSVIFQGPRLRDMNLNWMLMPTSQKDSENIRRVVNYLKRSALPQNSIKDSAAILEYPHLVRVNFFPWDEGGTAPYFWSDQSIIRMKHCFMTSVNVNYTAGNIPAFFEGGSNEPVMIGLSMNLVEVEYFLAKDYDGMNGTYDSVGDLVQKTLAGFDSNSVEQAADGATEALKTVQDAVE